MRLIGLGGGTGDGGLLDASDRVSGVASGAVRELSSQSLRRFHLYIKKKKKKERKDRLTQLLKLIENKLQLKSNILWPKVIKKIRCQFIRA